MRHEMGGWSIVATPDGHLAVVLDSEEIVVRRNGEWTPLQTATPDELQEITRLGVNASARLRSITVANSAAKVGTEAAWLERAAQVRAQGAAAMQALADSAPARWFTEGFIASQPQVVQTAQAWIAGISPEGYASCCEALAREDLRAAIADITTPTLLVAGSGDPVTTVADAQAMHAAIPGADMATVPASHLSNLEAPQAFDLALTEFLRKH